MAGLRYPGSGDSSGFSVYVHWPFCARICPYCDFNVRKNRGVEIERWRAALTSDLNWWGTKTRERKLSSLYFGGGTPSLAPPGLIEAIIEASAEIWPPEAEIEITLEANPTDAERSRFAAFRAAGVNRLSLGVQSFDDASLKFLGRDHDGAAARRALDAALDIFPRVSADFIYALPGETINQWADRLGEALATGANHLSLYQLTIEDGTAFARQVEKARWKPADEDRAADLFDLTQQMTASAGIPAYEISNHARQGEESRHNLNYWRQGDYVGVGPGAHGRVSVVEGRLATETETDPARYLDRVAASGTGAAKIKPLTPEDELAERLAMGLRTIEGASLDEHDWRKIAPAFEEISRRGLLERRGERLVATADGRRILDSLLIEIVP